MSASDSDKIQINCTLSWPPLRSFPYLTKFDKKNSINTDIFVTKIA